MESSASGASDPSAQEHHARHALSNARHHLLRSALRLAGFLVVAIIGALGGSIPLPASAGTVGGIGGMLILYKVDHNAAIAAVLLHQAIGLLVPLAGGGVAYAILRRRFGPVMRRTSNGGSPRPVR